LENQHQYACKGLIMAKKRVRPIKKKKTEYEKFRANPRKMTMDLFSFAPDRMPNQLPKKRKK
tara:strand:- start:1279 stop:1464 length:186 start_codon:yes stop_codon:yes gene_type:complete